MDKGLAHLHLMKTAFSTCSWLALLLSTAPTVGMAALPEIPGAVSTVTIKLTLSTTVEGTVKKSETTGKPLTGAAAGPDYDNQWTVLKNLKVVERGEEVVTKIVMSKYSNKEMLLDLKDAGVITDIKGWSISKVQATLAAPVVTAIGGIVKVQNGPVRFYLTHKTLAPVPIDDYIGLEGVEADDSSALALNSKRLIKYNATEAPISDVTTHTMSYKGVGNMYLDLTHEVAVGENNYLIEKELSLIGPTTGGEKLGFYGPQKLQVLVPAAGKLGPVFGFAHFSDERAEEGTNAMVEGSVAFGAGAVKNVGVFPNVTVDPHEEEPEE